MCRPLGAHPQGHRAAEARVACDVMLGWSLLESVLAVGSFLFPVMTLLTLAPFPVVRALRAGRGAHCQLVVGQPPAAKEPDARQAVPPRWERSHSRSLPSSRR